MDIIWSTATVELPTLIHETEKIRAQLGVSKIGRSLDPHSMRHDLQVLVRPNFRDTLETQYICDAVLKSGKSGQWKSCKA